MAELKTRKTNASVDAFLETVDDERRRRDCRTVLAMMKEATGEEPKMWGASIVGFGTWRYNGASGTSEWFLTGFSPRKRDLTLYIMPGVERYPELLGKLGKYTTGKSCLYLKKLADIDPAVLGELIRVSLRDLTRIHGSR
jgi:hypothetical protein